MHEQEKEMFIKMLKDRVSNKENSKDFEIIVELIDAKAFDRGYRKGTNDARGENV